MPPPTFIHSFFLSSLIFTSLLTFETQIFLRTCAHIYLIPKATKLELEPTRLLSNCWYEHPSNLFVASSLSLKLKPSNFSYLPQKKSWREKGIKMVGDKMVKISKCSVCKHANINSIFFLIIRFRNKFNLRDEILH